MGMYLFLLPGCQEIFFVSIHFSLMAGLDPRIQPAIHALTCAVLDLLDQLRQCARPLHLGPVHADEIAEDG